LKDLLFYKGHLKQHQILMLVSVDIVKQLFLNLICQQDPCCYIFKAVHQTFSAKAGNTSY